MGAEFLTAIRNIDFPTIFIISTPAILGIIGWLAIRSEIRDDIKKYHPKKIKKNKT